MLFYHLRFVIKHTIFDLFMSKYFLYRSPKKTPNAWGIEILNTGKQSLQAGSPYPPKNHPSSYVFNWTKGRIINEYQILLVTQGSGLFQSKGQSEAREFKAPFIFLVFPDIWHRYKPIKSSDWTEYWIGFKGIIPDSLQKNGEITSALDAFKGVHYSKLVLLFQQILQFFKQGQTEQANVVLHQILVDLCNPKEIYRKEHKYSHLVDQISLFIADNCHKAIDWEKLSSSHGISYSLLRKVFKQREAIPPKKYHTIVRLDKVKFFLNHTNMSLTEIADELGFNSPFHLSSQFKKYFGKSPKEWRS